MIPVYRQPRRRRLDLPVAALAVLAAASWACGGGRPERPDSEDPAVAESSTLRPGRFALADFLASTGSSAVDLAPDRKLALAGSSDGRGFVIDLANGKRTVLDPGEAALPLGFFPADRRVLFARPLPALPAPLTSPDLAPELRAALLTSAGTISESLLSARAQGRFLGWSFDGAGFYLARPAQGSGPEELLLVSLRAAAQTLYVAQTGFHIATVTPRGDRVALMRELDPDSTEVLLYDRTRSETRLLLPVDRDARFLPQAFSPDGGTLYLFADDGEDLLRLEALNLTTGERTLRASGECEAQELALAADGATYALQRSCRGVAEAELFATATGAGLGALPLPAGTRVARLLPPAGQGEVLYEVASPRFPRDLLLADGADGSDGPGVSDSVPVAGRPNADASAVPLTFGLAPAIAAEDLIEPRAESLRAADGTRLPVELWWPRGALSHPPGVIWVEDGVRPPAWQEFHPILQFLANRGIAVLRLRLRGTQGFGRRFRHAADGRQLDAASEDLELARTELAGKGVDVQRIALVGDGPWPGALAAGLAAARSGQFVAAIDLGGDPDPLGFLERNPDLGEPAKAWWIARLGDPASPAVQRDRQRLRFPAGAAGARLLVAVDRQAGAWSAEETAAFQALEPERRLELARGARSSADLRPGEVAALWRFLAAALSNTP